MTAKPNEDCHLTVSANHNVLNMNFIKVLGNAHINNIPIVSTCISHLLGAITKFLTKTTYRRGGSLWFTVGEPSPPGI